MKVTSVRVLSKTQLQIPGNRYIYPAQPVVPMCSIPPWIDPDSSIYNCDSLYPNKLIEISNSGIFDGARLVTIAVYPVQYRARSRRLFLYNNITFEFELSPATIPDRANIRGINGQKIYDAILKTTVENDADINLYYQPPQVIPEEPPEEQPPGGFYPAQYTIITTNELMPYFVPFANWLTDKGVPASVVDLSNVLSYWNGVDDAEKLRNYLIDAYKYSGTIWVLLGGDAGIVPFRYGWASDNPPLPSHYVCPSDLYFSDLNGNWDVDSDNRWGEPSNDAVDIYPEVFVGRILCRNAAEVTTWVNKVLYYEQFGSSDLFQFTQNTWIYDRFVSGIYPDPRTRQVYPEYYQHYDYNTVGANVAVDALNVGTGFYHIDTHGDVTKIATKGAPYWWNINSYWTGPRVQENDGLNNLNNINRYYVVYCTGCYCAAYDQFRGWSPVPSDPSDTTIADAFIDTYESTGAVAFLGNTRYGWPGPSQDLDYWFSLLIFGLGTPYEGYWQLGVAEGFSKVYYPYYYLCHAHNLFGSPEMIPWINYPGIMEVEHPISIPLGIPVDFTVNVRKESSDPISNAKVCLYKVNDIYEIGHTNENGIVTFTVCAQSEAKAT